MWKIELIFFLCFLNCLVYLFLKNNRLLTFLIYLEIFSVFMIFFFLHKISVKDYSLIVKILILISCESAVGLSLLVVLVRKFSVDNIQTSLKNIQCEGF